MKKLAPVTLAAAVATISAGAQSAPLTELFFSQNSGFLAPTFEVDILEFDSFLDATDQSAGDGGEPVTPAGTYEGFLWRGDNAPATSGIGIQNYNDETAPDADIGGDPLKFSSPDFTVVDATPDSWNPGDWWVIDTLIQKNETLNAIDDNTTGFSDPTWRADAVANLRIYADEGRTDLLGIDANSTTNIEFWESRNRGQEANCTGLNPLGTLCDDRFRVSATTFDPIFFDRDDYRYTFFFSLVPGDSLDIDILTDDPENPENAVLPTKSLVVPNGEDIDVYTPEFNPGISSIHVVMTYTIKELPLPSGLALFGAGLLALGGLTRRKAA